MARESSESWLITTITTGLLGLASSVASITGYNLRDVGKSTPPWVIALLIVAIFLYAFTVWRVVTKTRRSKEPLPPPAREPTPKPKRVVEEYPIPDYLEDKFFGIQWRWEWFFERPGAWFPDEIRAYCPAPDCDLGLDIGYYRPHTTFTCMAGHPPVTIDGDFDAIRARLKNLILRNWRNNRRGE